MRRILPAASVAIALALPGAARADGADMALPEVTSWQLDNGLTVAHIGVHRAPVVAVQVWYRAGAKDEPAGKRGLARMFERLMFQGSPRVRPGRHAEDVEQVGGYVSAQVTEDATSLTNVVPTAYLEHVLKLEAERMRDLVIREEVVKSEREVARERLAQELQDPIQLGLRRYLAVAYGEHPYGTPPGGTARDIDSITAEDVRAFYDAYYNPDNALLVVVGDVGADELRDRVEEAFGALERGAEPPRPARERAEPEQSELRTRVVDPGPVGLVIGGFHIPEAKHDDIYALQLLSLVLGSGRSSALGRELGDGKLARDTGSQALVWEDPGVFAVLASFDDPSRGDRLARRLLDAVKKLHTGPSAEGLRRAKRQILAGFVYALDDVDQLAEHVGTSWVLTGDAGQFLRDLAEFEAITSADVARVARKYLTEANYTAVILPPQQREGGSR